MKRLKSYLKKDESGEVMLEAAIIFPLVFLIIFTMLSLGFLFYQRTMLSSVAAETASAIGNCFKYDQNLDDRNIDADIMSKLRKYRMSLRLKTMKEQNKNYGNEFVKSKVGLANIGVNRSDPKIESLDISVDDVGRLHVTVEVSIETDFFLSDILEYLDIIDSSPKFTAKSSAEVLDMTGHFSYVNFVRYFSDKAREINVINSGEKLFNSTSKLVDDIKKLFNIK